MKYGDGLYWWLMSEKARELKSDGCTYVNEWNQRCCLQHDVHYRTGYHWKLKLWWDHMGLPNAELVRNGCITRKMADEIFYQCNRAMSPSLWGRMRARVRYLGVRSTGWRPWNRYRKEDGIECPGGKSS
jgi:hypothetical protein